MKYVKLTRGKKAIVDDADYEHLSKISWHAEKASSGAFYAKAAFPCKKARKGQKWLRMHRFIMGEPSGKEVDHINMDTLDNRRRNLRVVTPAQNRMNRKKYSNNTSGNTSGYKGVSFNIATKKWCSIIQKSGVQKHLGYFPAKEEAALAYNVAAKNLHKEFANFNIIKI